MGFLSFKFVEMQRTSNVDATLAGCGKMKWLSFRSTLRAEESLSSLTFKPREIPHFVRNDNQGHAFRKLLRTQWRVAPIQLRSRDSISFIFTLSDAGVRPNPTPNSTFRNLLS